MLLGKTNFALCDVATLYTASNTVIALAAGEGAKLPTPSTDGPFPLTWWDDTTYPGNPNADPNREVTWCGSRSGDTVVISRGAESAFGGGAASTKNTSGSTYQMALFMTAKVMQEIEDRVVDHIRVASATMGFYVAGSSHLATRVRSGFTDVSLTHSLYDVAEPIRTAALSGTTPLLGAIYRDAAMLASGLFKGTATVSIYASFNVGSFVRNATGDYTIYFKANPSHAMHLIQATREGGGMAVVKSGTATRSLFEVQTFNTAGTLTDAPTLGVTVWGLP